MDPLILAYSILGGIMCLSLVVVVLVIAGKEILFAFQRRFSKKGVDVYITDRNRDMQQHFKAPKEGTFKIDGNIYLTNPYKISNLSEDMLKKVNESMDLRKKRFERAIGKLKEKLDLVNRQISIVPNNEDSVKILQELSMFKTDLENKIELLVSKLEDREQSYYMRKKRAYFFIEGDPIPKDFFEYMTEMDSIQLENVILRAQTKDPKNILGIEKNMILMKKLLLFALIGLGICIVMLFKSNGAVVQIAENMGITLSI